MQMTSTDCNPLPGVPAVESPFFASLFASDEAGGDTLRIATQLREHGLAVLDFPEPDFDRIADGIRRELHPHYDWLHWWDHGHAAGEGLRLQDAHRFNEGVRRLASNARIAELLSRLFGRRARPFQTLNFPVGAAQKLRTDALQFSSVPERFLCSVWVALEDVGPDAGPLVYCPGSHRWPVYAHAHLGRRADDPHELGQQYEQLWHALALQSGIAPQRFFARKGQALIRLSNLLHGGVPQANPGFTRWSQLTHYCFEDCAYYEPLLSDPVLGRVAFREMTDIGTGQRVRHSYAGAAIPPRVLHPCTLDRWLQRAKELARPLLHRGLPDNRAPLHRHSP